MFLLGKTERVGRGGFSSGRGSNSETASTLQMKFGYGILTTDENVNERRHGCEPGNDFNTIGIVNVFNNVNDIRRK